MRLSLIVALSRNRVIGRDGQLPWRLSADLRRFKQLTMNHHLLMGRKTYESIGRLLPGRTTIVISRQPNLTVPGGLVAGSLSAALSMASGDDEAFVIGGAEVYDQALPLVERLYVTRVHADVAGDVQFPALAPDDWTLVSQENHAADEKNEYDYSFEVYDRVRRIGA